MSTIPTTAGVLPNTTVTFSADAYSSIAQEAARLGLPVDAYLVAINAVQTGRITREMLEIIGEIFTNDDEILRELAK